MEMRSTPFFPACSRNVPSGRSWACAGTADRSSDNTIIIDVHKTAGRRDTFIGGRTRRAVATPESFVDRAGTGKRSRIVAVTCPRKKYLLV
jgi:hypothetical protein